MPGVMITNGNNVHSPEYHAEVTTAKIFEIVERTYPDAPAPLRDIKRRVEGALVAHHSNVHNHEHDELEAKGEEHCNCELDSSHHHDACCDIYQDIKDAVAGTAFAHIFERDDVRAAIIEDLHHETRSQMNVHRVVFAEAMKRGEPNPIERRPDAPKPPADHGHKH